MQGIRPRRAKYEERAKDEKEGNSGRMNGWGQTERRDERKRLSGKPLSDKPLSMVLTVLSILETVSGAA